jgi:pyruvate kinase
LWLKVDDSVRFLRGNKPCRAATPEDPHALLYVDVPEVFRDVRVGQRVFLDDGKFGLLVTAMREGEIAARVTLAPGGLGKLGSEKGINLPDTRLVLPALGADDRADLAAVLALRPDFLSLSFAQRPADVADLHDALLAAGEPGRGVGVVLKIETAAGFAHLPALILAALRRPKAGLMIARGDLGVEVGFARLSEVQEEILWLAEAAHVPSIWATQVLDSLARTGVPTRGDVTDAVAASRAEAVMLNKGPFMDSVLAFVDDVFARHAAHHSKQMHTLRGLSVAAAAAHEGAEGQDEWEGGRRGQRGERGAPGVRDL